MFLEYEDFCGADRSKELNLLIRDFFELAADMRSRLGQKSYVLDSHLEMLLLSAAAVPLFHVSREGNNAGAELRRTIRSVTLGESGEGNPMSETIGEYIAEHPLPWQENYTRYSVYFAALLGDYAEYAAEQYRQELADHIRTQAPLDIVRLRETRQKICGLIGGEADMERLEKLFRQCFLAVMPAAGFLQGMTDALISELTSRDEETSKLIFQLVLDSNLAYEE